MTDAPRLTEADLRPVPAPVRLAWVRLPHRFERRGLAPLTLAFDGHYLTSLGALAGLLPLLALGFGVGLARNDWWFDTAVTESAQVVVILLAIGIVSTQLGAWTLVGYAVTDFFLTGRGWTRHPPDRWLEDFVPGFFEQPLVASFAYDRVPLLIHYALLGALMIGVPFAARMLTASIAGRVQGSARVRLFILACLSAVAVAILTRFWTVAAPHVVRPLFTWEPAWRSSPSPPAAAIAPVQANAAILRWAAGLMLARFLFVGLASRWRAGRLRMAAVEIELGRLRRARPAPERRQTVPRLALRALWGGLFSVLMLAGLIEDLWVGFAVFGLFVAVRILRTGLVPLPTDGWREAMNRIPVLLRFAASMLLVHGIASAVIGTSTADSTFQTLVWPIAIGMAVLALLIPSPRPRRLDVMGEDPS